MNAPATCPTETTRPADHARVVAILGELAQLAHKTDQRCGVTQIEAIDDRDPFDVQNELDLLRATICRLGWLADLAAGELGAEPYRGDAAAWMAPAMPERDAQGGRRRVEDDLATLLRCAEIEQDPARLRAAKDLAGERFAACAAVAPDACGSAAVAAVPGART